MKFIEIGRGASVGAEVEVALEKDGWDDNGRYQTLYRLRANIEGTFQNIGKVRIGYRGQKNKREGQGITSLGDQPFTQLPDDWISLGVDEDYYETLHSHGARFAREVLKGLNDLAFLGALDEKWKEEDVVRYSIMRGKDDAEYQKLRRLAQGDRTKIPFELTYVPLRAFFNGENLTFSVTPNSTPSTNVHAIIGSNGAGKSSLLRDIAYIALQDSRALGSITISSADNSPASTLNQLVFVSYSIFDEAELGRKIRDARMGNRVEYVGIDSSGNSEDYSVIDGGEESGAERPTANVDLREKIANDFSAAVNLCASGYRRTRWLKAIEALKVDPVFEHMDLESLVAPDRDARSVPAELFQGCSSGHAISLLIITKLIVHVGERCLVLVDEPETHLHPPLLSALLNAISEIVSDRNGLVILATHSPVALQEIPAGCVWVLNRFGDQVTISRPRIETFGENLSTLTREVFRLELHKSGFHKTIVDMINDGKDHSDIFEMIPSMGSEARALTINLAFNANGVKK
ncbi:AAA family ATPase [Cereibacter azotoformans]|uniref:Putative AbiEii toxin of type IV toxin-antitoxin system n=1 Tax=Cereibacter azotoformans TaxID=43057 RepID=A0A2T5JVA5_9RHOB|nr:AAA family ATPase [Cereibacter azotoformans]MBO4170433.1 AAA family ATPase [Cereibacter azotoformans]PTR14008.1 putative AbiEii toxin of type IV toxin-antitoxin system [Cereibacter azotoformans]UIJ30278.1 AAA family ATPase [Cereibacter azotoformans]